MGKVGTKTMLINVMQKTTIHGPNNGGPRKIIRHFQPCLTCVHINIFRLTSVILNSNVDIHQIVLN